MRKVELTEPDAALTSAARALSFEALAADVVQRQQRDVASVVEAVLRFSGVTQRTDTEHVLSTLREELRDLRERARVALTSEPCSPGVAAVLQSLFDAAPASEYEVFPEARLSQLAETAPAKDAARIRPWLERVAEFRARVAWLVHGTSDIELESLDPLRDCDRIRQRVMSAFRVEGRILETLAINRIAQSLDLLVLIRSTRRAEQEPVQRFFDTYALLANFFEWGADSARGRTAAERMRQIHGRYYIPNDGMKYVLLQTAFTWLDGAERIGHRPLLDVERRAVFHSLVNLGRALQIAELNDDFEAMYAWYQAFNEENRRFHPQKQLTFQRIVDSSLHGMHSEALRGALHSALVAGMDETYREAVGEREPSPEQLALVRAGFLTLAQVVERLPQPLYLRSLQRNPARAAATPPDELGADARSAWMPRLDATDNGGFPSGLAPVTDARQLQRPLPEKTWQEVRQHCSAESLWVVIDGYVYDLTPFVHAHPGGLEILLQHAGKDASAAYQSAPHTALTDVFRANYCIGRVV